MRSGSTLLAATLIAIWAVVYLITQILVQPPLGVLATLALGAALSTVVVLGYPSALRGPRATRPTRTTGGTTSEPVGERPGAIAAGRSMPLRSGLTVDASLRTAQRVRPLLQADAIAITDREQVLAFVGVGESHHQAGDTPLTAATSRAVDRGRTVVERGRRKVGCGRDDCPLQTVVIAPLAVGKRVVGALKVYRSDAETSSRVAVEDMASILSLHLELAEMDRERKLATDARLDALRAQINPHFLFNILNTISSKARTDPEEARQLLLRLSDFFRYAVRQDGHFAEFAQEYFFVRTYVSLEQARFGDRLRVRYDIDPQVLTSRVPVLTIQPLVENAVKHGIADKVEGGTVHLRARVDPLTRTTSIRVSDDGVGMNPQTLAQVTNGEHESRGAGVGLRNISERLESLFGQRYSLDISSSEGSGTVVHLKTPLR